MDEAVVAIGRDECARLRIFVYNHGMIWHGEVVLEADPAHDCPVSSLSTGFIPSKNSQDSYQCTLFKEYSISSFKLNDTNNVVIRWCSERHLHQSLGHHSGVRQVGGRNGTDPVWDCPKVRIRIHFHIHEYSQKDPTLSSSRPNPRAKWPSSAPSAGDRFSRN